MNDFSVSKGQKGQKGQLSLLSLLIKIPKAVFASSQFRILQICKTAKLQTCKLAKMRSCELAEIKKPPEKSGGFVFLNRCNLELVAQVVTVESCYSQVLVNAFQKIANRLLVFLDESLV